MSFDMSDYNTVPERIVEFREKFPDGSLSQVSLDFREVAGGWWVVYVAAANRNPDDPKPGIGTAWEPIPGKTNFTRDSEVQNAETAAWGRAIIAVGAADARKGVASREEVQARRDAPIPAANDPSSIRADIARIGKQVNMGVDAIGEDFSQWSRGEFITDADATTLTAYRDYLDAERKRGQREHKQLVADVTNTTQAGKGRKDSPDKGRVERSDTAPAGEWAAEPAAP